MHYRPEIDGLRALAVIPVILFHAGFELFSGGFVGVDIFFVISGYLITTIILSEMDSGCFSLKNFYERRARRVLPALFFVMALSIPFAWMWLTPDDLNGFWKSIGAVSIFSSNFLFLSETGYFGTEAELKPLLHTWSLAVEEQYYILFPLFIISTWHFGKRYIALSLVFFFVVSLSTTQWATYNHPNDAFYLLPTRGWEILLGTFAAFIFNNKKKPSLPHEVQQLLGITGLALILYSVFAFDKNISFPSVYTLIPTTGALLLILFAENNTLSNQILSNKSAVSIGLISYSAYLWHQPLFALTRQRMLVDPSAPFMASLCVITFILAFFSWRYIEKPFRTKETIGRRTLLKFTVILTTAFLIVATTGYLELIPNFDEGRFNRDALRKDAKEERQKAIKAGICHFNRGRSSSKLAIYLTNWHCHSNDENLFDSGLLVFGDSHSADRVVALAQNGVDVVQIGGAGCPLSPQKMTGKLTYCKSLISLAEQQHSIERVVLVNRFKLKDLNREYLAEIISFWSKRYNEVILFTPMPNFKHAVKNYILFNDPNMRPSIAEHSLFKELISTINVPDNVIIIDTYEILCGKTGKNCSIVANGDWLLTDYGHLSVKGARIFGDRLKASKYSHLFFKQPN